MKIKAIKFMLCIAALFLGASFSANAFWNRFQFLSVSPDSPLNPTPGVQVTNVVIDNPSILTILQWSDGHGNSPGHVEFEMANGYYSLIFVATGLPFQMGVMYTNVTSWAYPISGKPAMLFTGLGRSYLSLYPDSYFKFNELELDVYSRVVSCQLEIYQHGHGWSPYYSDGEEWILLDYHRLDGAARTSLISLVPEPGITALFSAGLCLSIVFRRWSHISRR